MAERRFSLSTTTRNTTQVRLVRPDPGLDNRLETPKAHDRLECGAAHNHAAMLHTYAPRIGVWLPPRCEPLRMLMHVRG
jgi:hypothetical protein